MESAAIDSVSDPENETFNILLIDGGAIWRAGGGWGGVTSLNLELVEDDIVEDRSILITGKINELIWINWINFFLI